MESVYSFPLYHHGSSIHLVSKSLLFQYAANDWKKLRSLSDNLSPYTLFVAVASASHCFPMAILLNWRKLVESKDPRVHFEKIIDVMRQVNEHLHINCFKILMNEDHLTFYVDHATDFSTQLRSLDLRVELEVENWNLPC